MLDHTIEVGNPPDAPQLAPAVARITTRTGRTPRTVTADRGYGEKSVDDTLHDLGVRTVVIPAKANPLNPDENRNTDPPSVEPSSGAQDAKAASATSNAATAGTAPASTTPRAPGSGPDTASWPTT